MAGLYKVFIESLKMLSNRPQLFVPRLISTCISSFLLIGLVAGWISIKHFIAAFPVVAIIGAFTPVMVSAMAETDQKNVLMTGLSEALNLWKSVALLTFFTIFLAFVNSLPFSIGLIAWHITGNLFYLGAGVLISFLILVGISFGLYFVPISIVKKRSFLESLEDGISTSTQNSREVTALILFSLVLLAASSVVTGKLRSIGFTVFFLGRIASSILGSYLLVISPKYYLEEKQE
jgi:hypothetical protein